MKKLCFYFFITLCSTFLLSCLSEPKLSSSGIFFHSSNDSYILFTQDGSPIILANETKKEDAFNDLSNGDEIEIAYADTLEIYPPKANVLKYNFIKKGTLNTAQKNSLEDLNKKGYKISY